MRLHLLGQNLVPTRRATAATLLLAAAALSVAAIFSPSAGVLAAVGPALLLYTALNGLLMLWRPRATRAGAAGWESVILGTLGAAVALWAGAQFAAVALPAVLGATLLLEQRPAYYRRAAIISGAVLSWAAGLAMLLPALWMLAASLRPSGLPPPSALAWWPVAPSLDGYARLFALLPVARYLANSLLIACLGVALALPVASAAGFALVFCAPHTRRVFLVATVAGLSMPPLTILIGRFLIFRWLHLLDTPLALLAPVLIGGTPLTVLVFYAAFRRISPEQWDQARLDGADPARIWLQIALSQVRGLAVAMGALVFCLLWGAYAEPLFFLSGDRWRTLPAALQALLPLARSDWPSLMAGALVIALFPVIVLIAARRALLDESAVLLTGVTHR